MPPHAINNEYDVSADKQRLDIATIHEYLAQSYWSPGIPRAIIERAIEGSLCFGVFLQGRQVGFARVVTTRPRLRISRTYSCRASSRKGLSKRLMQFIFAHPDLQGLRRFMLATKDAHRLYEKFGFKEMLIRRTSWSCIGRMYIKRSNPSIERTS